MSHVQTPTVKLVERECKHAIYVESQDRSPNDLLVIKEYLTFEDGTRRANLRQVLNYERPYWITRERYRNHKDKKEWEDQDKLQRFTSPQHDLQRAIARSLRTNVAQGGLRKTFRSPYVYGADVTTPVLEKMEYQRRWPNAFKDNTVAVTDVETDVFSEEGEIIMQGLTFKDKCLLVVTHGFMEGVSDPINKIKAKAQELLGDIFEARNITLDVKLAKNAGEVAYEILQAAHAWQPDFLSLWNMDFDIPKMIAALEKYGYNLANVWSDPAIHPRYRKFFYKKGPNQRKTASGGVFPLAPAEQWHTVEAPASFYVIDSMCVYQKLRIAGGKSPVGYSLDAVLNLHLGMRKLKFEEAAGLIGLNWHKKMQKDHKVEYAVYCLFDCIGVELLDEVTTDLSRQISVQCGYSEYHRFPSQPRRTCDRLHEFVMQANMVAATTSDQMGTDLDQMTVGLRDWIVTLPSHLVYDNGLQLLEELPTVRSMVRAHVADLDMEGTYPTEQVVFNISKATTKRELVNIEGLGPNIQRSIGVNLSGGHVNATEICVRAFNAPTFDTLLDAFQAELSGIAHNPVYRANEPTAFFIDSRIPSEKEDEEDEKKDEATEEAAVF